MEEAVAEPAIDFIPSVCFIKRGVAKQKPDKVVLTTEELARVIAETKNEFESDDDDDENEENIDENVMDTGADDDAEERDEFDFENYDEESTAVAATIGDVAILNDDIEVADDDDDSEAEDEIIKPNDNLILVGHVSDDSATMEVYVFNEDEPSLYVHHDFLLPSFPLCIEWLNHDPGSDKDGNMCAIGCMDPIISVWDLDIQDSLEPAFKLGSKGNRKKRKEAFGHSDAVLDLSWNINFPHILASASVDQTVILWDLDEGQPHTTITAFEEKVQAIAFNPTEAQSLLAGSADGGVRLFDCRNPETVNSDHSSWKFEGEVEKVIWQPTDVNYFMVGTNEGQLHYVDSRKTKDALWSKQAHTGEVSGIAFNSQVNSLLTTTGSDGLIKIWKFDQGGVVPVYSEDMQIGRIQCMSACPDDPFTLAFGGEKRSNRFRVYNIKNYEAVRQAFDIATAN